MSGSPTDAMEDNESRRDEADEDEARDVEEEDDDDEEEDAVTAAEKEEGTLVTEPAAARMDARGCGRALPRRAPLPLPPFTADI